MNPSRELDALVAEKVMGWTAIQRVENILGVDYNGIDPTVNSIRRIPEYSWKIQDAWLVVEKFDELILEVKSKNSCVAVIGGLEAYAETAPHAICLAALKAAEGT